MKIAFEASSFVEEKPTGVAVYIQNYIDSFLDLESGVSTEVLYKISRLKYKKYWYKSDSIKTRVYHNSLLPVIKNTDIIHGLDCFVPAWKRSKKIVNVYEILPDSGDKELLAPVSFRERKKTVLRQMVSRADLFVTCSENTRKDVMNVLQVPESQVVNVYPGVNSDAFKRRSEQSEVYKSYKLDRDYLMFLGSISGRKNTANLVEAFAKSKAYKDFDLVLVGADAYNSDLTHEAIKKHDIAGRVKLPGYVGDEQIPELLFGSKGFVFPTFYEGFGFPILEAMLCEVPVLTSNTGSAPEVGGDHALYVDPYDVESISEGIDRLVERTDFDVNSAREYAAGFTWEKTAKNMLQIYKDVFDGNYGKK